MSYPKETIKENLSLEDRLARKFDDLQIAREIRNPTAFDEIARSIEILFKAIPNVYDNLMEEKQELDNDIMEVFTAIEEKATNALDNISKQAIIQNESYSAEWEYRETYEEIIIELLQKYKLIPMKSPSYATIESKESTAIEPNEEIEEEIEEVSPIPQPKQEEKKPKLSIKRKQRKEEDEFKV